MPVPTHRRRLSAHEINHLNRHHHNPDLSTIGETPVEYLTGHADFLGLDFAINQSALIPRIESEKIIEIGLNHLESISVSHPIIADIGTGSGCLGISLIFQLSQKKAPYTIFLSDISHEALQIAITNANRILDNTANIYFEQTSLFNSFPQLKFHLILANLPYIPSDRISSLPDSVKNYEPISALDGGPKGVSIINNFLKQLPKFLDQDGLAILEIDDSHTKDSFSIPTNLKVDTKLDVFDNNRFLIAKLR